MSRQTQTTKNWRKIYSECRADIFALARHMRFNPTPQQREVLQLAQDGNLRMAVKSGQGPGKTTCSVIIGIWWTLKHVDSQTIITAPSMKQCKDVWLSEARRRMKKAHPLLKKFIRVSKSRVLFGGPKHPNWRCLPITATNAEAFQGIHESHLNAIVEEASGMSRDIIEALKGTVSNTASEYDPTATEGAILMIGNPNTRDCAFFDCFNKDRIRWACLTLNAEESPIVSKRKIQEHEDEFGRDSDFFRVRVLGEFPSADPHCVINPDDVEFCATKVGFFTASTSYTGKQFGIDLARFGSDESVIYRRANGIIIEFKTFAKTDPADVLRTAFNMQAQCGWKDEDCVFVVDAGGMGQGVMHVLRDANKRWMEFHFNSVPYRPRIFKDRITEAYFMVAKMVKGRNIKMPNDRHLIQQLCTRQYTTDKDGLLILESKKDYVKRTKTASPDRADAFVMACYLNAQITMQLATAADSPKRVGPV
jgi:phage terminase large subunit